ncbi:KH domain-containing, RNA-binding, signal transduction-associated protein 2 isoform X1 [Calliphora vicina]|uniref:KH domain-containing, RNA-binding, signal transduction-associated protein 2 isoform X1 n=1 Tax=Calliphora vicina TaxID=7373 RepID=UPI00325B9409
MANAYEGNGEYSNYADDESEYGKQRKMAATGPHNGDNNHGELHHHGTNTNMTPGENNYLNEKANDYIRDCLNEKSRMDRKFPISEKLLDTEIEKVQTTGRLPSREQKYADIYREKPLRVSQKVLVPIREHPKFNFVGKLLGPKGNSLRRLQEETMCKMTVLGRNSMRDRVKEEELRNSKDPKYSHLNSDLHVEISTVAPPAEAYARVAYAMAELRKYLIPDSNDVIRQEQLRELMDSTHISEEQKSLNFNKKVSPYQVGAAGGGGGGGVGILTGGPSAVVASLGPSCSNPLANQTKSVTPYRSSSQNALGPSSSTVTSYNKTNIAPKQKVMSILEKARSAMEETYGRGYDDNPPYEHHQAPHSYDAYATYTGHTTQPPAGHNPHGPQTPGIGISTLNSARAPYENVEYETSDYNRRDYYQNPSAAATPNYGASGIQPPNNGGINPNQNQNRSHVNR